MGRESHSSQTVMGKESLFHSNVIEKGQGYFYGSGMGQERKFPSHPVTGNDGWHFL